MGVIRKIKVWYFRRSAEKLFNKGVKQCENKVKECGGNAYMSLSRDGRLVISDKIPAPYGVMTKRQRLEEYTRSVRHCLYYIAHDVTGHRPSDKEVEQRRQWYIVNYVLSRVGVDSK